MEKNNIHSGHRSRMRSIITTAGLANLPEHQILEYVLSFIIPRKDTNVLAHRLITQYGNIKNIISANKDVLAKVEGLGERSACFLVAINDLLNYIMKNSQEKKKIILKTPFDSLMYFQKTINLNSNEIIYMACTDKNNVLKILKQYTNNNMDKVKIDLKPLVFDLNHSNCSRFIIVHNHLEGNGQPSIKDNEFTKSLCFSATLAGFTFCDHIIIAPNGYYSYRESGILTNMEKTLLNSITSFTKSVDKFNEVGGNNEF